MKVVWFAPLFLLLSHCSLESGDRKPERRDSESAQVDVPLLDEKNYAYDEVEVLFHSRTHSDFKVRSRAKSSSSVMSLSMPADSYQVEINYFLRGEKVLSNLFCEGSARMSDFLIKKEKLLEVNVLEILVCNAKGEPSKKEDFKVPANEEPPVSPENDPREDPDPKPPLADEGFRSGINVAWIDFARDVGSGSPRLNEFRSLFRRMASAGGKVARLWLHTNGAKTPKFDNDRVVSPGDHTISDLTKILEVAREEEVQLILCLWSFDMLVDSYRGKEGIDSLVRRNRLLLTDENALAQYLDRGLAPLVEAVKGHPSIHSFEVVNEPEGMTPLENWSSLVLPKDQVEMKRVQVFVNKIAGRIKRIDPAAKLTSGAVSFKSLSPTVGQKNFYSDEELIAAGGDPLGTLDFYQVHYYLNKGPEYNPFSYDVEHWGLDKEVWIGEFYMKEYFGFGVDYPHKLYKKLLERGYQGALGWKDGANPSLALMVNAMSFLNVGAELPRVENSCADFGGGYGYPWHEGEALYRRKSQDDGDKCRVE